MRIENHGSFCNIYGNNGGISFGTCERNIAEEKIKDAGGDPSKYPLFLKAMENQDKNNPQFALQTDPCYMCIFDTEKYPEIVKEMSE